MNRRLQQFLELEQLTPSRLADTLGVQRSGLSHILSGRNKPGYDFINKILLKFPQINAEWLITGKGKPYKNQNLNFEPEEENTDIFTKTIDNEINISTSPYPEPEENKELNAETNHPPEKKEVKRVTLFFSDGSYQEFFPK